MKDNSDDEFEAGDADAADCHPCPVGDIKKGGHVAIKGFIFVLIFNLFDYLFINIIYFIDTPLGRPCKVIETNVSKTGKHGHAKTHIVALDIFTGKKLECMHPSSHNISVPDIERSEYTVTYIDDEGFCSLMDDDGNIREDLKCPESEVGENLQSKVECGKECTVAVIRAMGIEQIMTSREL
jgi:translation initiation factor 5A